MEGDFRAAAHFFSLAEGAIGDACATAEAVNLMPGDGMTRLREIARRLADGGPNRSVAGPSSTAALRMARRFRSG